MNNSHPDMHQEVEKLRERNHYLEECNLRYISILDVLASSSDFQADLNSEKENVSIFMATFQQLKRLLPFQKMAFFINADDNSFDLAECFPDTCRDEIGQEVDDRIMDGSFAWAINQNHPIIVPASGHNQSVILQALATKNRIRGMFAGLLPGSQTVVDAPTLNALVTILVNTAYAMESAAFKLIIRDHVQNLEMKVDERTVELQKARKLADAANLAKSSFLANMSHELRTPLNAIIGFSDVLLSQGFGPLNPKQEEYLGYVFQSSRHLLDLINDILDLSKVEADKMELQLSYAAIKTILENSLIILKEIAHSRNVHLTLHIDPSTPDVIWADERKLKQIMYNLLSNAVKFTPAKGHVTVTAKGNVSCSELPPAAMELLRVNPQQYDTYLIISISDTGIGLQPEDLERIFKPFEQADNSSTRGFEGTGLGLTLARRLLSLHGGTLWAESAGHGHGSTFRLVLPQQKS